MSNVIDIRILRLARVFRETDEALARIRLELGHPVEQPEQSPLQRAYARHQVLLDLESRELSENKSDSTPR